MLPKSRLRAVSLALAASLLSLLPSCGSDSSAPPPSPPGIDVTGTWTGAWEIPSVMGGMPISGGMAILMVEQDEVGQVTGTISLNDVLGGCITGGGFTGGVSGMLLVGSSVGAGEDVRYSLAAVADENETLLGGNITVIMGAGCTGTSGTLQLSRPGSGGSTGARTLELLEVGRPVPLRGEGGALAWPILWRERGAGSAPRFGVWVQED